MTQIWNVIPDWIWIRRLCPASTFISDSLVSDSEEPDPVLVLSSPFHLHNPGAVAGEALGRTGPGPEPS